MSITTVQPFAKMFFCLVTALSFWPLTAEATAADRPNFLVIVADDLGWADLGSFGSEIRTPSLDAMAARGLTLTNFRVAPTCSPTRAMLLTGVDNHLAGLGTMDSVQAPNQVDSRNYQAQLHDDVVTVAEALVDTGYATLMVGKWHLAVSEDQYPHQRGFDRSFSLLQGGASHFGDRLPLHQGYSVDYLEDGEPVGLPDNFYSSISYTDKAIQYLDELDAGRPFFAYVAYTAPHDPLQVPDEWLDKYRGTYDEGPAVIRGERIARQQQLGLIPAQFQPWSPPAFPGWLPMGRTPWDIRPASERARDARSMEIYASMVQLLDEQIGRLLSHLEHQGLLDNTYVIFLSDNGANAATPLLYPHMTREWFLKARDHQLEHMGMRGSHTYQGREWAAVSNGPLRLYKATVAEGGVRVPLIVTGPGVVQGQRSAGIVHVTDIASTVLDLAGVDPEQSDRYEGKVAPEGRSLRAAWRGESLDPERSVGMELFGNRALIRGRWKALNINPPLGSGQWHLYDLENDPGEMVDLSDEYPDVLEALIGEYGRYAARNRIIPPAPAPRPSSAVLYAGPCDWWCQIQFEVIDIFVAIAAYFLVEE